MILEQQEKQKFRAGIFLKNCPCCVCSTICSLQVMTLLLRSSNVLTGLLVISISSSPVLYKIPSADHCMLTSVMTASPHVEGSPLEVINSDFLNRYHMFEEFCSLWGILSSMNIFGRSPESSLIFIMALLTVLLLSFKSTEWHRRVHFSPSYSTSAKNMGGLLHPDSSSDGACLSKTQHHLLGRKINYRPSSYLVSRLRRYESIHQRCAPEAESFQKLLNSNSSISSSDSGCKFVVWISFEGLGNKLLSLVSAFIYALLTDRVLLVDRGTDMEKLLCEPFRGSSWFAPLGFPVDWMHSLDPSPIRLGRLVDRGSCEASLNTTDIDLPLIAYMQMDWHSTPFDKMFFCEHEQQLVEQKVKWLMLKANAYYIPSLYLMPSFRHELEKLFPEPATTFQYAARYLLHPTNSVWLKATRFFKGYLDGADSLLGLQLRPFDAAGPTLKMYSDQLWQCLLREKLLPDIATNETTTLIHDKRVTSVLVTSLHQIFADELQSRYVKYPTVDGSMVKVHSPSHDVYQQTNNLEHDEKALMEIFLLAMSDSLVTSPRSTFGYVAHGLAGLKPWTLHGSSMMQDPICSRMLSSDPCFLTNPDVGNCNCPADATGVSPCLDDPRGGMQLLPGLASLKVEAG